MSAAFPALLLTAVAAGIAEPPKAEPASFIRSRSRDGITAFETAIRSYQSTDGAGPRITLVGVVHIGDKSYYDGLVEVLDGHELVMFESVLPRGAFGTTGRDDAERQRKTQEAMLFLRGALCDFVESTGSLPQTLDDARAAAVKRDTRSARPIDLARTDGWGRPLSYRVTEGGGFELASMGRDGAPGGRGVDLDLVLRDFGPKQRERLEKAKTAKGDEDPKRDLYGELASALDTDLQVRSIDYDRAHWVPADLPMEELLDRLWIRGERSATIEMVSNPSGFQQGLVRFLLSLVSKSPGFKKMVIEALGSAGANARRSGLSSVDTRIILDERNDAVIDQLRRVLAEQGAPRSIAIFYGAAHMPDFERTLRDEFGLAAGELGWHRAMWVDEWTVKRIKARREKLAAECAALGNDGSTPDPERVRALEGQIAELDARIAARSDVGKA